MIKLTFTSCEKKLTKEDILNIEESLGVRLPDDFKEHYLQFNGGDPDRAVWLNPSSAIDSKVIRDFIPMRYRKDFRDDPDFTLEGNAKKDWNDEILPENLIPFAMDWQGHYFCLNHKTNEVFYFLRDCLNNLYSPEETLLIKNTPLAPSFSSFLGSLVFGVDTPDSGHAPLQKKSFAKLELQDVVKRIEKEIRKIAKEEKNEEVIAGLSFFRKRTGATDNELADFAREYSIELPDDFKALYRYKDGSGYPFSLIYAGANGMVTAFYLLSLDEIRELKGRFCNKNMRMQDFPEVFSPHDIGGVDERILPLIENTKWIPFAQLVGGSVYLMLDYAPSSKGRVAQIISYVHDPDFIYYVADNTRQLLEDTLNNLVNREIDIL